MLASTDLGLLVAGVIGAFEAGVLAGIRWAIAQLRAELHRRDEAPD